MKEPLKQLKNNAANIVSLSAVPFALTAFYFVSRKEAFFSLAFIGICFFIDTVDGYVARKLKIDNPRGPLIDSFNDLVAYLLFPCFFMFGFMDLGPAAGLFTFSIVIICGMARLSRFTQEGFLEIDDRKYYRGLITPFVLAAVIAVYDARHHGFDIIGLLPVIMTVISLLMVSQIKFRKISNWPGYLAAAFLLWMAF